MQWPPKIGDPLPRKEHVWFEQAKVDWVLGAKGHGSEWRRVFRVNPDDWERVWGLIVKSVVSATVKEVRDNSPFGLSCGVEVSLVINGRTAPVRLGWHYANEDSSPRLVTAYPTL